MYKLLGVFSLVLSSVVFAGHSEPGQIFNLYFMKDGRVAFTTRANHIHDTSDQQCVTKTTSPLGDGCHD